MNNHSPKTTPKHRIFGERNVANHQKNKIKTGTRVGKIPDDLAQLISQIERPPSLRGPNSESHFRIRGK